MNKNIYPESELSLAARIEAILFVAPLPVTINQLASVFELSNREVQNGIKQLEMFYKKNTTDCGLRLQIHRGRYQLTTAPAAATEIEKFLGLESKVKLSRAALETLSIILYFQPVTRPKIDSIRGVNSDGVLKSLLRKGLIQEEGRTDTPGRPILYGTTPELLQHFGINSLNELPKVEIEESMIVDPAVIE